MKCTHENRSTPACDCRRIVMAVQSQCHRIDQRLLKKKKKLVVQSEMQFKFDARRC